MKDFGGRRPTWGYAASPVIFQDKLLIVTGAEDASLISLDTETGEVFWKKGNYEAAYATPAVYENEGEVLVFHESGLSIHALSNGEEKSFYQHKTRYGINAAQPINVGKNILVSSAYGKGSALIDFRVRLEIPNGKLTKSPVRWRVPFIMMVSSTEFTDKLEVVQIFHTILYEC